MSWTCKEDYLETRKTRKGETNMKKLLVCALCAAMVVPAFSVSVSADSKELVLYTWENMFPQEVLDGFEE